MSLQEEISRWDHLASEARAGRLYLDDAVAKSCRQAIDDQITVYTDCLFGIEQMAHVTGLGDFECGKELARLLGLKAVDQGGDGDLKTALQDHIRVLELMGDTIQVTLDRLQEQDSTNSQGYNGV
ncbi:hypothetical protein FEK35_07180 [Nocardia cyriacigeorgica]|uniref:Uncharacterized protein n=1 Tax=Nocardia cyriacigeorgica TaxID=135487 RepID=A0A5R8PHG8_9NOCA|nr:hypothetical protein [Nocardia cyriacigeorgica]TLG14922.1 hypothetical protein FEK35_07180 [Nocardia cyriacigeorgica]